MISTEDGGGRQTVVVTFPMKDQAFAVALMALCLLILAWYLSDYAPSTQSSWAVPVFLLWPCVVVLLLLRTRVEVDQFEVRQRILRWKRFPLPEGVAVKRAGPLICLVGQRSSFVYRFPSGLAHGRDLEKQLELLFESHPENAS